MKARKATKYDGPYYSAKVSRMTSEQRAAHEERLEARNMAKHFGAAVKRNLELASTFSGSRTGEIAINDAKEHAATAWRCANAAL